MIDMVLSEKSTGLRLAPSQHIDSCRTVKKKSNPISNKSTSYSRQRQLRGTGKNAPVVSNSKEVQPEKKGGRNATEAAAPSSQLGEMKWHDFQKAERENETEDMKLFYSFIAVLCTFLVVGSAYFALTLNLVFAAPMLLAAYLSNYFIEMARDKQ